MNAAADFLVVGTVAFLTVLLATPVVGWIARRVGAVAAPRERDVHKTATPTMGGLAIFAGILAAIAIASFLGSFDELFALTNEPEAVVLASVLIVGLGVLDDMWGVSAPAKLAGQILAAGLLVIFGLALRWVWIPGNPGTAAVLSPDLQAIFTIGLIVAMMNAVNLVDGLDGLAAGIVTIAAAALFLYTQLDQFVGQAPSTGPLILVALVGACLGFLVHNFNPASIFMGDTGAMLLGLLLGSAGVSAVGSSYLPPGRGAFAALSIPVLVPIFVLAIPFLDTVVTIVRRLLSGRAVFSPDKRHLHHRLLEIGHSQRRAVLIMYYWSALLAFATVGASQLETPMLLAFLGAGVGLAAVVTLGFRISRRLAGLRER
jgi:UDP-GlcNAc:undecaprenyl-phosphate/decaprenyl-phosphate GlcNAc-1-phosphate transferase